LRCRAIVGPANNQIAEDEVAERLRRRGIHWVPDYLAGAGGVIYAVARELHGAGHDEAAGRVRGIGELTAALLREADRDGISPHRSALRRVRDRLSAATTLTPS
ncbi:MAG: Glu/Leu/Phe/Val dehydrogenase, partial [Pseudonocardia sp.]|nr:Glu/Leu/Phe/Val dehydrogenase [Pseudonocardia sp.]